MEKEMQGWTVIFQRFEHEPRVCVHCSEATGKAMARGLVHDARESPILLVRTRAGYDGRMEI